MEWKWKNSPTAWRDQYTGHWHDPTIILDGFFSKDIWISHCYIRMFASHIDINVLKTSPLFASHENGEAPTCNFNANGHEYDMSYYLASDI